MRVLVLALALVACSGSPSEVVDHSDSDVDSAVSDSPMDVAPEVAGPDAPRILSAFFGLDDALPAAVDFICPGGAGRDGMPVVFSRRVSGTPAASAFRVTTRSGATHTPVCATLAPAVGATERHTVLLGGDFGGEPADPPVRIEIVESMPLEGGGDARGLTADVTPLSAGPALVLAMRYLPTELKTACPASTRQLVQVTWNGGVSVLGGADVGDAQRLRMHVVVARDGGTAEITPEALADLGDNDNYMHLCLSTDESPLAVRVEASTFVDPRGDLNAETRLDLTETR